MNRLLFVWDRLPRPAQFSLELAVGLAASGLLGWTAQHLNRSKNRDAQTKEADVQARREETIEVRRIADALERAYPAPKPLPRPSLLDEAAQSSDPEFFKSLAEAFPANCADARGVPESCAPSR